MKRLIYISALILALTATSCTDTGRIMPNISGSAFELLLVINDSTYRQPAGETIFNILSADMEHLPQAEPLFKISRIQPHLFDNLLKTTRNIIFVTVNPNTYTTTKIRLERSRWARQQAICTITSESAEHLEKVVQENKDRITNFFILAERERMMDFYKGEINAEALRRVNEKFGCNIALPTSLNKYNSKEDFLWISNGSVTVNQNIIIYSVPYTSTEQLTHEAICARRDSVLKANLPGGREGSYMGTEYRYEPPTTRIVNIRDSWTAETRGLWRMQEGEIMGGPFVSLTRIDEQNMRIITVEGFIFAPGKDKRNPLRQLDAMVYSLKLPYEIGEVVITKN